MDPERQYESANIIFNETLAVIKTDGLDSAKKLASEALDSVVYYFRELAGSVLLESLDLLQRLKRSRFEGAKSDYFAVKAAIEHASGNTDRRDAYLTAAWNIADLEAKLTKR